MRIASLILLAVVSPACVADPPKPFSGKVVKITDGDTITVLVEQMEVKVRLNGIDAPERAQAFGDKAKSALADRISGETVEVKWSKTDRNKRVLGDVYLKRRWINREMVEAGRAWHYRQFSSSEELAGAQKEAASGRRGLWQDRDPVPPWEFRKK